MIRAILLDLDGTVYMGTEEVPGAADFVRSMASAGVRCLYVTNRSNRMPEEIRDQLLAFGMPCETGDVVTTAQATARILSPGRVYVLGEEGLTRILEDHGFTVCEEDVEAVIVGWDRGFNYEKLRKACSLIGLGADYVATNPDRGIKLEDGFRPGTGAILAAINAVCRTTPRVIGKPEPLLFEIAVKMLGIERSDVLVVGDNLDTDIAAARAAGIRSALILTGVSSREDLAESAFTPDWVVDDFASLAEVVAEHNRLP